MIPIRIILPKNHINMYRYLYPEAFGAFVYSAGLMAHFSASEVEAHQVHYFFSVSMLVHYFTILSINCREFSFYKPVCLPTYMIPDYQKGY